MGNCNKCNSCGDFHEVKNYIDQSLALIRASLREEITLPDNARARVLHQQKVGLPSPKLNVDDNFVNVSTITVTSNDIYKGQGILQGELLISDPSSGLGVAFNLSIDTFTIYQTAPNPPTVNGNTSNVVRKIYYTISFTSNTGVTVKVFETETNVTNFFANVPAPGSSTIGNAVPLFKSNLLASATIADITTGAFTIYMRTNSNNMVLLSNDLTYIPNLNV